MNKQIFSRARLFLILLAVVAVAGAACYFAFGFNLGFDYEGGTQILVDVGSAFDIADVRSAFQDAGVSGARYLSASDGGVADMAIVRVASSDTSLQSQTTAAVQTLTAQYPDVKLVSSLPVGGDSSAVTVWKTLRSFGIILLVSLIYVLFRGRLAAALTLPLAAVAQLVAAVGISLICRLEINETFSIALLGAAVLGLLLHVILLVRFGEVDKRYSPRQFPRLWPAGEVLASSGRLVIFAVLSVALVVIVLGLVGLYTVSGFALPFLIAILVSGITAYCFTPACWVWIQDAMNKAKHKSKAVVGTMQPVTLEKMKEAAPVKEVSQKTMQSPKGKKR